MFTHYLITRFNIKVSGFGPERMDSPAMSHEWLQDRLAIFLTYTAPSVLAQTNTNFRWLIYFDPASPSFLMDQVNFLLQKSPLVEFRYTEDYSGMLADLVSMIKNSPSPYVITSRVDNDDIISSDFIKIVQHHFKPRHNTIINLNAGYEYSMADRVLKKWNNRFNNQFISLIEETAHETVQSVYAFPHWRLPAGGHVINVPGDAYWIYIRHNLNYSEGKVTGIPVFIKPPLLKDFPASVRKLKLSRIHTFRYALKWFPQVVRRRTGL